jgi:pimeloyl-ACP methyl ester carboxylesterase
MREDWFEFESTRLFARTWGTDDGPLVLFWHGLGVRAGRYFDELVPALASRVQARFVTLDAPGFGRSGPLPPNAYRTEALVEMAVGVLDSLGASTATWVGWSWGAGLGCHAAAQHPTLISALVLLDGGYRDVPSPADPTWEGFLAEARKQWDDSCFSGWPDIAAALQTSSRRWSPRVQDAWRSGWHEQEGRLVPTVTAETFAAAQRAVIKSPPSSSWTRLRRSQVPVLLLAAEEAPSEELSRFTKALPQAEVKRVAGAGHDVVTDEPATVTDLVASWLTETR